MRRICRQQVSITVVNCSKGLLPVVLIGAALVSSLGHIPFVRCGAYVLSEWDEIISFVQSKVRQLAKHSHCARRKFCLVVQECKQLLVVKQSQLSQLCPR